MDGLSNSSGSGAGLILTGLKGDVAKYALWFEFLSTNNKVEYEVLTAGLRIAKEVGVQLLLPSVTPS